MYITDVDFARAVIEYSINDAINYYVASFYMGAKDEDVERFATTFMQMLDDRNLSQYRGRLIVKNDGDSEISSLNTKYINSFGFTTEIDCSKANSPYIMDMVHTLINETKGRKFDCIVDSDSIVHVSVPYDGVYAEDRNYFILASYTAGTNLKTVLEALGVNISHLVANDILYIEESTSGNKVIYKVTIATVGVSSITGTITQTMATYTKRKISIALTEVSGNIPFIVNKVVHMRYNLSGKATVCDENVELGNDTVKVELSYDGTNYAVVEPLSLPSDVDFDNQTWRTTPSSPRKTAHNSEQSNKREYDLVSDYSALGIIFRDLSAYGTYGGSITANTVWYARETVTNYGYSVKTIIHGIIDKVSRSNTNGDVVIYKLSMEVTV